MEKRRTDFRWQVVGVVLGPLALCCVAFYGAQATRILTPLSVSVPGLLPAVVVLRKATDPGTGQMVHTLIGQLILQEGSGAQHKYQLSVPVNLTLKDQAGAFHQVQVDRAVAIRHQQGVGQYIINLSFILKPTDLPDGAYISMVPVSMTL